MYKQNKLLTSEELKLVQGVAVGEMGIATSIVLFALATYSRADIVFGLALISLAIGILVSPIYPIGKHKRLKV